MGRPDGKVALVMGGARGLGQAYAERLAQDGADILIADLHAAPDTKKMVTVTGRQVLSVVCDVSLPEQVDALAKTAFAKFGKVDIVINNAGIYPFQPFDQMTFIAWFKHDCSRQGEISIK